MGPDHPNAREKGSHDHPNARGKGPHKPDGGLGEVAAHIQEAKGGSPS